VGILGSRGLDYVGREHLVDIAGAHDRSTRHNQKR
jgi:hypothetical protein